MNLMLFNDTLKQKINAFSLITCWSSNQYSAWPVARRANRWRGLFALYWLQYLNNFQYENVEVKRVRRRVFAEVRRLGCIVFFV